MRTTSNIEVKDQNNHGEKALYLTDNTKQKKRFAPNYYPVRYRKKKKKETSTLNSRKLREKTLKD